MRDFVDSTKNMVEGRGSSDEPMTRRKNVLRRCDDQIVDTADPYINPPAPGSSGIIFISH